MIGAAACFLASPQKMAAWAWIFRRGGAQGVGMQGASLGFNLMPCVAGGGDDSMAERGTGQRLRQMESKCCENERKIGALAEQVAQCEKCLRCLDERTQALFACAQGMKTKVSEMEGSVEGVHQAIRDMGAEIIRVVKCLGEASAVRSAHSRVHVTHNGGEHGSNVVVTVAGSHSRRVKGKVHPSGSGDDACPSAPTKNEIY